ncbi:hypothetical protein BYT27DRAFT_6399752 [Phlegmacium glaucopus]|nr:hypothetical protein BYT27DRAFT_6399752 [Phlegmacium glaucopus]
MNLFTSVYRPHPVIATMATPTDESNTEHEILTYIRVQQGIDDLVSNNVDTMTMVQKTPLTKALDAMSYIPFVNFPVRLSDKEAPIFSVENNKAGTLYKPNVDVILEKSVQSSFGRGSETVLDPSYRSGREILAQNITLENKIQEETDAMSFVMFPGREVAVKLYKLAIYETGGHFDWHMDSTHSDKHQATLLVALNTSWEGGGLVLRCNDIETPIDLQPKEPAPGWIDLQAVAFFTDIEHRVEPVKSGIRIVLQYDIELLDKPDKDQTKDEDEDEEEGEDEDEEYQPWMDSVEENYSYRMDIQGVMHATADKKALEKVLTIIKTMHKSGTEEVAFALQHLYRRESILAKYLKGSDATLYNALLASGDFNISLYPVILREESDYDGVINKHRVYRCDEPPTKRQWIDEEFEKPKKPRAPRSRTAFHIPKLSGIQKISSQRYIEHTGNEAMPAEYRYFGGGMFVRPKAK